MPCRQSICLPNYTTSTILQLIGFWWQTLKPAYCFWKSSSFFLSKSSVWINPRSYYLETWRQWRSYRTISGGPRKEELTVLHCSDARVLTRPFLKSQARLEAPIPTGSGEWPGRSSSSSSASFRSDRLAVVASCAWRRLVSWDMVPCQRVLLRCCLFVCSVVASSCLPTHPIHRFALVCFPSCASRFDGAVFCDQRMAVCFSPLGLGSVCFGALFFKKSRSFCNLCCLHLPHIHE
jgi:hypothetical protein